MQLGVDFGTASDQFELVDVARIQATAFNRDDATLNVVTIQATVLKDGPARTKRDLGRVDKTATVTADTMWVGKNDMGGLPGHFGVALELTGATAVDFIEDQIGGASIEVAVANDVATQLRTLQIVDGVVEDDALLTNVEVAVLVMRQAGAVGRGNVHHRNTVGRLPDSRRTAIDHDAVGERPNRLPKYGIGEDERESTLGQPPE
ncbi:hypothetical protein D3C73_875810 [compost metagenome]